MTARDRTGYWMTRHAAEQARDRGIPLREIRAALATPEVSYPPNPAYPRAEHRATVQAGRIGVVVDDDRREVVTVVFRYDDEWIERGCLTAGHAGRRAATG